MNDKQIIGHQIGNHFTNQGLKVQQKLRQTTGPIVFSSTDILLDDAANKSFGGSPGKVCLYVFLLDLQGPKQSHRIHGTGI